MTRLVAYAWPGNIRELRNVLERAVILTEGTTLVIDDDLRPRTGSVTKSAPESVAGVAGAPQSLADAEREHIKAVLARTQGVIGGPQGAAKIFGVPASTLRSLMARLGLDG